jgi:hypothetical protein
MGKKIFNKLKFRLYKAAYAGSEAAFEMQWLQLIQVRGWCACCVKW